MITWGGHVEASQQFNPDLFWALRGGGGNFGVVTALEYQLHPVGKVLSGTLTYPAAPIPDLLQAFVRFLAEAPDEMDALPRFLGPNEGQASKSISAIAAIHGWGVIWSGRCVRSNRRTTASRSCLIWKLSRQVDFF